MGQDIKIYKVISHKWIQHDLFPIPNFKKIEELLIFKTNLGIKG